MSGAPTDERGGAEATSGARPAGPPLAHRRPSRRRWLWRGALAALLGAVVAVVLIVVIPDPSIVSALGLPTAPPDPLEALLQRYGATEVVDRDDRALAVVSGPHRQRALVTPLREVSPRLVQATLAAEDQRFFDHHGVDPVAVVRAAWSNLRAGRVVSGASTLTQQLARMMHPQRRGWRAKIHETLVARQLERQHDKATLLGWYLSTAPYGGLLRGAESAAQACFGRSAADLTWAQAALLAVIPRSPQALDPRRHLPRARRLADALLRRMHQRGALSDDELQQALDEEHHIASVPGPFEAPHVLAMLHDDLQRRPRRLMTTLDAGLQRTLQAMVRGHVQRMRARGADNAALVVLDARTGAIAALVGSQAWGDVDGLGANNGALALRQPGSALKPFAYALRFDEGGSPAEVLLDVESHFAAEDGDWRPQNYAQRFHGPVRARLALANSLNVPAVRVAAGVGLTRLHRTLLDAGLTTMHRTSEHYGLGLVLGDAEVTLLDLAGAYTALAAGGEAVRPTLVRGAIDADGRLHEVAPAAPVRIVSPQAAWLVTDVLADEVARAPSFGRDGDLTMNLPVAVKTGTSKGYRDAIAVGYDRHWVVAVWVGNFDGRPMNEVTGATGAGPLLRDTWMQLARVRRPELPARPEGLVDVAVCPLSGLPPGPDCPHEVREAMHVASSPRRRCDVHRRIAIDRATGLRAGQGCEGSGVERRLVTDVPAEARDWAQGAGWPLPPPGQAPPCRPGGEGPGVVGDAQPQSATAGARLRIASPQEGARYWLDSSLGRERQAITLRVETDAPGRQVRWTVDGREVARGEAGQRAHWTPVPGSHLVRVEFVAHGDGPRRDRGAQGEQVQIDVLQTDARAAAHR